MPSIGRRSIIDRIPDTIAEARNTIDRIQKAIDGVRELHRSRSGLRAQGTKPDLR